MTPTPVHLAAPCPTCKSGIGLPCVSTDHSPRPETHLSRRARAERLQPATLRRMALDRNNAARRTNDEYVRAGLRREARALIAAADALTPPLADREEYLDVSVRQVGEWWEATARRRYVDTDEVVPGTNPGRATRPAPVQAAHAARHQLTERSAAS